jgi:hypothetical protein
VDRLTYPAPEQPRQRLVPQGDFDRAIADYNQAIKLNLKYAVAYANCGSALGSRANSTGHRGLRPGDPAR